MDCFDFEMCAMRYWCVDSVCTKCGHYVSSTAAAAYEADLCVWPTGPRH